MTHAVVLGGGMAGMLAAAALADHFDRVTIVEADTFPDGPAPRRGLPQGHHFHMFMGGGVDALDKLLPGTSEQLYAAGAQRRRFGDQFLGYSAHGWSRPYDGPAYVLACSRPLLDHVVRGRVLVKETIRLLPATKAVGLVGSAGRVRGVLIETGDRERAGQDARTLPADLVVDATGRSSRAPQWLAGIGAAEVLEEVQDAGFAYAGRTYRRPDWAGDDFPAILVQAEPGTAEPGRGGGILPNEDGTWIVAMIGTRGAHPPADEQGHQDFMRGLDDPLISRLVAESSPLTEIRTYRGLVNQRRRYDRLPVPGGFLVVGDAALTLNPNYATGMSIAAISALALRTALARGGPLDTARVQKSIAKVGLASWQAATTNDSWFPGSEATMKIPGANAQKGFIRRWNRVVVENAAVARATFKVASFLAPRKEMMALRLMIKVIRGPRRPILTYQEALAQYPEFRVPLTALEKVPAAAE